MTYFAGTMLLWYYIIKPWYFDYILYHGTDELALHLPCTPQFNVKKIMIMPVPLLGMIWCGSMEQVELLSY